MKMHERCLVFLAIGLLATLVGTAQAELIPIFEYSFPDSYDGTSTVIDDLADTNDGTMAATGGYEADVRPPGFTSGGSIDGGAGGYGLTDAINLLTNVDVAAAGGFTFDTWVMLDTAPMDGQQFQFVSNCGADALVLHHRKIKANMYNKNGEIVYIEGPTPVADQWYHLVYQFDTMGNEVDVDGYLAGEWSFIVDDVVVGSVELSRYTYGSTLNRPIGINCKGESSDKDVAVTSHLFNPSVSLGIVPEPSALVALAGLLAMLFVRRLVR